VGALLYAMLGQVLSMLADYWLRWWAEERFGDQGQAMYKWVFAVLVASTVLVGYHKAHVWLHFALNASSSLHSRSLWSVLHSPMQFFGEWGQCCWRSVDVLYMIATWVYAILM
jgi:hypothetical protein